MTLWSLKHLQDELAAYTWIEEQLWPHGPVCPYCGATERKRISKMEGKSTRIGFYKCYACRKKFNVKIGTMFESSHVPLHLWLRAFHLMAGSTLSISASQLAQTLNITHKPALSIWRRIEKAGNERSNSEKLKKAVAARLAAKQPDSEKLKRAVAARLAAKQ